MTHCREGDVFTQLPDTVTQICFILIINPSSTSMATTVNVQFRRNYEIRAMIRFSVVSGPVSIKRVSGTALAYLRTISTISTRY